MCSGCGQPKDQAWDEDAPGYYDVQERTCAGCKAAADHGHGKPPESGTKTFVVLEQPPDSVAGPHHDPGDEKADSE